MAYIINPSPFHTSMGDLLAHFRFHCMDASAALLERDALWRAENEALRNEVTQLRKDLAARGENVQWLNQGFHTAEEKAAKERAKREELERQVEELRADLAKHGLNEASEKERARNKELEETVAEMQREAEEKEKVVKGLKEKICGLIDRAFELERDNKAANDRLEDSERLWSVKMEAMGKGDADLISEGHAAQEELRGRIGVLEKEKAEIEIQFNEKISELEKKAVVLQREKEEKEIEIGRVLKEKVDLETGNKILGEERNKKMLELKDRVGFLELERANGVLKIEKLMEEKMSLEAQNNILETEARVLREKKDNGKALETQKRLKEEAEMRVSGFLERIMILEREKEALKAEVLRMEKHKVREEEVKIALEAQNKILETEARIHREKKDYSKALETQKRLKEEAEKQVSGFLERIMILEREKEALKAEVSKMEKDKVREEEVNEEKIEVLCGRIHVLEKKKGKLEEEVDIKKKKIPGLVKQIEKLKDEKRVDAELISELRSSLEKKVQKDTEIERVLEEKTALEKLKTYLEEEVEKKKKTIPQLLTTVEKLMAEKRVNTELILKLRSSLEKEKLEKDTEIRRVFLEEKMALEMQNKILEGSNEKISELEKKVVVLEREKVEMEARVHKEKKDVSNELNKALETQKRMEEEAEKRVSGFLETIMVLEREKEALTTKVSKLYEEKCKGTHNIELLKRIHVILNGNITVEDYERKTSELEDRISILEKEKRELETSIGEKDEVIKVLDKENSSLEDVKKELELVIKVLASKLKEDEGIIDNVDTLSTPRQNKESSVGVAGSSEHRDNVENSDGKCDAGMTRRKAGKRRRIRG